MGQENNIGAPPHIQQTLPSESLETTRRRFREFDLQGKVFVVTGGGRGLGLAIAEALVEAGGRVWCLDRLPKPDDRLLEVKERAWKDFRGSLDYQTIDVTNVENLRKTMESIASEKQRLDGLVAAAGIQHVEPAIDHTPEVIEHMMSVNYTGVFMAATAAARQMLRYKCRGSIVLVASMSGFVANKGLLSPVYNSSKAAVIQLGRNLAMEWGKINEDGSGGIRVNSLCPGHIRTPMVEQNFKEQPELQGIWESENMLGRIARPEEFRGPVLYLLSDASSFQTGSALVVDGGHTAW